MKGLENGCEILFDTKTPGKYLSVAGDAGGEIWGDLPVGFASAGAQIPKRGC